MERQREETVVVVAGKSRPGWTTAVVIAADGLALVVSGVVAYLIRGLLGGELHAHEYISLWPALFLFLPAYYSVGLYPGVGLSPSEELERLSLATTSVYLALAAATFIFKEGATLSRGVFFLSWLFSLALVPLTRSLARALFARKEWWGRPVIVLGAGATGRMVVQTLLRHPGLGLKPLAVFDDDEKKRGHIESVPILGGVDQAALLAKEMSVKHAIVAMPGVPREQLLALLERHGGVFPHLLLIPDLFGFTSLWVLARDMGGVLALEIKQRLLLPGPRILKRVVDLVAAGIGGFLILPLMLLIAIIIKIDSRGPIFYGHERIGQGGKRFKAWKFRSMVEDADAIIERYLEEHPELREEWQATQKLKNDPRVTRVGRWLRKLSLDELPQLWNVIRGEMSLVGPRPIVQEELAKYGEKGVLYLKVKPGMTGLWQVSGRSETSYQERVEIDAYYVRNWSVWLDLYILARTVWVVLFGRGAY